MTIFLSSDLHLNHANIIRYCKRPFKNVEQMNSTIIKRWNEVVGSEDTVYYLGDFCMGDPLLWLAKLKGDIKFIQGNHDKAGSKTCKISEIGAQHVLSYKLKKLKKVLEKTRNRGKIWTPNYLR